MNFTVLIIIAMITWGISWPIGKLISTQTIPEVIIFWRNGATTLSLLPLLYFFRKDLTLSKNGFLFVISGSILMTLYNYLFFAGLRDGLAGLGGVIVTTTNPLVNYLIMTILGFHQITKNDTKGLSIGLIGGAFLLKIWSLNLDQLLLGGNLFFLIASILWAILTIISSRSKDSMHPIVFSFYVYMFSTILTIPTAYTNNFLNVVQNPPSFWWGIFYLSAISTGFGTTVYFISSTRLGSQKASSYIFMVPGTAIISSWILMDEVPDWTTIIGGTLAMLAVKILHNTPELPMNTNKEIT
ncbi:MAG: DMT family transporter [Spirochaetia bacterium]|nr:DMT family transporter [Spirochaetia bacterium]